MSLIEHGLNGPRLQSFLGLDEAATLVARTSKRATVAVTRYARSKTARDPGGALPTENAFLVILHLTDCAAWTLWHGERAAPTASLAGGAVTIHDLRRSPAFGFPQAHEALLFYLPHAAMDNIAQDAGAPQLGSLREIDGAGAQDSVVRHLATLLLPALDGATRVNRVFIDSVILAIGAHLVTTYGQLSCGAKFERGGLAPWQERKAKAMLLGNMDGGPMMSMIARECGLSESQFTRSFRKMTGLPPHQWLMRRRVDKAKSLLTETALNLAQIGQDCGFADQSHFTRTFTALAGVSPGAWRRRQLAPQRPHGTPPSATSYAAHEVLERDRREPAGL